MVTDVTGTVSVPVALIAVALNCVPSTVLVKITNVGATKVEPVNLSPVIVVPGAVSDAVLLLVFGFVTDVTAGSP
jgi:hypothetical protein